MHVVGIKHLQVVADSHIAEAESALDIIGYHVDGHAVVFIQLSILWQHIELLNLRCSLADAPAQQHVELEPSLSARLAQSRHVEGLGECHHGHGRLCPQLEDNGPVRVLGIDFLFHRFLFVSRCEGTHNC